MRADGVAREPAARGMSEEDKKPFAVKDRRHFTAEGDARPDGPEVSPADDEPERRVEAPPVPSASEGPAPHGEPDLVGLLLSLAAQASALLGLGDAGDEGRRSPGGPGGSSRA